jgi:hypothetical protein
MHGEGIGDSFEKPIVAGRKVLAETVEYITMDRFVEDQIAPISLIARMVNIKTPGGEGTKTAGTVEFACIDSILFHRMEIILPFVKQPHRHFGRIKWNLPSVGEGSLVEKCIESIVERFEQLSDLPGVVPIGKDPVVAGFERVRFPPCRVAGPRPEADCEKQHTQTGKKLSSSL